jgi:hypothetical protein
MFLDFLLANTQAIPARNIASCMHYVSSLFNHWLACTPVRPLPASNITVFGAFRAFSGFSFESVADTAVRMHFPSSRIYYWLAGTSFLEIMLIHSAVQPPARRLGKAHLLNRLTWSQAQSQRDAGTTDLLARPLPYSDPILKAMIET